ncbi:RNB domain-containing ribonuclease [Pseudarthrobacter sp. P1]|uniref:RNB domain-containing ribonuclease n=1 Tax=Pseudarthrobacter sp. P1 TaxID=3418418 RepID=UPI003CF7D8D3
MSVPYTHIDVHDSAAQQQLSQALEALKTEFKLPGEFSPEVLAEVAQTIADHQLPAEDLTDLPFLTIDPPASMDLDQAMYLEKTATGYLVHYAIADVPSFVPAGGALDAETRLRGQTYYTPDGRVPLHPAAMSEDAASLFAGEDRAAFVWEIALDGDGVEVSTMVRRARIRSIAKLGYEQAQQLLDAGATEAADGAGVPSAAPTQPEEPATRLTHPAGVVLDSVLATLALLKEIGLKRIELERARGGASLNVPQQEVEFIDGRYRLAFRPALPIEDWNAQISLLTGMAAAALMLKGKVGILRTMPEPDQGSITHFRRQSVALGKPWPADMPYGEYLRALDTSDPKQLALMHAARSLFRGAGYTPFDGKVPGKTIQAAVAHEYAHTTAPLRRLVDRFVLVICAALCAGDEVPQWARDALPALPGIMVASDQLANKVDRAAVDTVEAAVLSSYVGQEFDAVVLSGQKTNGNGNGHRGANGPISSIQIQEPAVDADCEGDLEPGATLRVRLLRADIATRTVLFTAV